MTTILQLFQVITDHIFFEQPLLLEPPFVQEAFFFQL